VLKNFFILQNLAMPQSRQLAAIMFTDIAGYTALMGDNEQEALELLEKNRLLQKPIIAQYNGRWIKELGDGVLASFNTVSDAVNAAIKIQESCNQAKEFQLRIGIHLGEVVFESNDVFGDGVNVASRIQAIAVPGAIYISESVQNNISNKKEITTRFVKEENLKNWLYKIASNKVVDYYRKRKIKSFLLSQIPYLDLFAKEMSQPEFILEKNQLRDKIELVMKSLSQKYQQIIDYAQIQSEIYIVNYSLQQLPTGIS